MAESELDQSTQKPKRGRGRPRKNPVGKPESKKAEQKRDGIEEKNGETEEEKDRKPRKALRHAVKKAIRDKSTEIATALVNKVVHGDKRCTEMMFSLIEKKKKGDAGAMRHGGLTTADLLGSEEQWEDETGEAMEGKSEIGTGGREPEQ